MTTYFCTIDSIRRHHPEVSDTTPRTPTPIHPSLLTHPLYVYIRKQVFQSKLGQFAASAGAATFGFWVVWPLEVLKASCVVVLVEGRENAAAA
jgi:hypothetical protein